MAYDSGLTEEMGAELKRLGSPSTEEEAEVRELAARLEGEFPHLFDSADHRERTLGFLRGDPRATRTGSSQGPVRDTLAEMVAMSGRLDGATDPSDGLSTGEAVGRRAHELAYAFERLRPAIDPGTLLADAFRRLGAWLNRLIRNVVVRIEAFAKLIGATSFTVGFSIPPPMLNVALTFGGG